FINPWIRLGNVFDKQDRNQEEICAYEKALELDPSNAQNWYELGNLRFRTKAYDKAVEAYNKSIECAPESGWSYNNLALTLVSQGKYSEALPLYQKGVDLIEDDKDKAVVWNRIGNVYRKLNLYDLAVRAFQTADDLDAENAGFRDELDDVPEGAAPVQSNPDQTQEQDAAQAPTLTQNPSPMIQLILSESQLEEAASLEAAAPDAAPDPAALSEGTEAEPQAPAGAAQTVEPAASGSAAAADVNAESPAAGPAQTEAAGGAAQSDGSPAPQPDQGSAGQPGPAPVVLPKTSETYIETPVVLNVTTTEAATVVVTDEQTATQTAAVVVTGEQTDTQAAAAVVTDGQTDTQAAAAVVTDGQTDQEAPAPADEVPDTGTAQTSDGGTIQASTLTVEETAGAAPEDQADPVTTGPETDGGADSTAAPDAGVEIEASEESEEAPSADRLAYDEYLKDNDDLVLKVDEQAEDSMPEALQEPATMVDPSGELQIEMDTKNAHVWNELGNIYFNTGAFDDAIVAYSKAIQLDRWFAWPYSNLALTYVQKNRFTEAILLYQRSIELFSSEKDKAVSWNRLGNVYRRLNNYDGAISAYQRADELDPENTTLSLQSRFSLLGNYSVEQMPSRVSQTEELP
ncbi:MAG TPA: tetratricopeptide repeat protein, partial [Anaerolineales bacterium]|nr:tetratricopeptide repeat protein [Anaerolineales bacterium]